MNICIKHFNELTAEELYEIYKVRTKVFVVEQNCPYQDVDGIDKTAYHIWLYDDGGIKSYLRLFMADEKSKTAAIGRVLATERRCGYASAAMEEAVKAAKEKLGAEKIILDAQCYARGLYDMLGFKQTSGEFLIDGIPHIKMKLDLK